MIKWTITIHLPKKDIVKYFTDEWDFICEVVRLKIRNRKFTIQE